MSANFCQTAVGPSLQLGRRFAGIKAISATELQTRNADDNALVTIEVATPTADAHATTKLYVDNLVNGLSWKEPVRLCTAVALPANTQTGGGATLTADVNGALPNIDGIAPALNDRLLVKDEGGGSDTKNGIYEVTDLGSGASVWILTRTDDALAGSSATSNAVFCSEGSVGSDTGFVQQNNPALYNTDATSFAAFASIVSGVTSLATAAGVTGITVLESGAAPIPTLRAILGQVGVLVASLSGTDVLVSVVANGIDTAQIAADAVGNAQLAPFTAVTRVQGTIVFGDAGSTVNIGTVPANSTIVDAYVRVTTLFDTLDIVVNVRVNAVSVLGNTQNDLNVAGLYLCDDQFDEVGTVDAVVGVSAGLSQGAATITVCYLRTA